MTFSVYAKSPVSHEIKLGPSFLSTIPYTKSYNFSNILYFFTTGHLKTERKNKHLESLSNNHGLPFMLNFLKKNEEDFKNNSYRGFSHEAAIPLIIMYAELYFFFEFGKKLTF